MAEQSVVIVTDDLSDSAQQEAEILKVIEEELQASPRIVRVPAEVDDLDSRLAREPNNRRVVQELLDPYDVSVDRVIALVFSEEAWCGNRSPFEIFSEEAFPGARLYIARPNGSIEVA